jgi:hypothetical protein
LHTLLRSEIEPSIAQDRKTLEGGKVADEQRSGEVQRWTAKRGVALVISLLKGETMVAESGSPACA